MALLKKGEIVKSDLSGNRYRVDSRCIRRGGFGEIYRGSALGPGLHKGRQVAIKATRHGLAWHGESYFGRLLEGDERVVRQLDAFPLINTSGGRRKVTYLLALDWMDEGSVRDALKRQPETFPESSKQVREQLANLLELLALLHGRWICHGDITLGNVFLEDGRLVLGDFGIAKQIIDGNKVELDGFTPDQFAPPDNDSFEWSPSDDVYQLGLLALSMLSGWEVINEEVCREALTALDADDSLKGWIRDATLGADDRFYDAEEALEALVGPEPRPARAPRSLEGEHVAITGFLSVKRDDAKGRLKEAGGFYENHVTDRTSVLLAGRQNALQIGVAHSVKRYDVLRRIRRGQEIAIISERQFDRLASR